MKTPTLFAIASEVTNILGHAQLDAADARVAIDDTGCAGNLMAVERQLDTALALARAALVLHRSKL